MKQDTSKWNYFRHYVQFCGCENEIRKKKRLFITLHARHRVNWYVPCRQFSVHVLIYVYFFAPKFMLMAFLNVSNAIQFSFQQQRIRDVAAWVNELYVNEDFPYLSWVANCIILFPMAQCYSTCFVLLVYSVGTGTNSSFA